jgi:GntR family transcriptional regulator
MTAVGRFATRPLYLQVKDTLVQRIVNGDWKAGAAIPNEIELSRELGISVGTVRKALDEMENERLISRRQGRGTFVIDQSSEESAFRFINFRNSDGLRIVAEVRSWELAQAAANEFEAHKLRLRIGEPVFRLHRVLFYGGSPFAIEDAVLPQSRFPGLAQDSTIPPTIVGLANNFGILLARAEEKIEAASASKEAASALEVQHGTPLLKLDCIVYAIDGQPIEWSRIVCHLRDNYYHSTIH